MDDDDFEPPKLSLAASNDPDELKAGRDRERCLWHLDHYTRELAGNMLRIIRGAGRPHQLMDQIIALYREMENAPPGTTCGAVTETMQEALRSGKRDPERDTFGDELADMEGGALRAVAGRILRQQLQASAGERELLDGYYQLERGRRQLREEREAAERAYRSAQRALRSKPKKRVTKKPTPLPPSPTAEPELEHAGSTAEFMKARQRELDRDRAPRG